MSPLLLLCRYPFDIPSEAFTFTRFKQAFAAIQASIVHLQVCVCVQRYQKMPESSSLRARVGACAEGCVHAC